MAVCTSAIGKWNHSMFSAKYFFAAASSPFLPEALRRPPRPNHGWRRPTARKEPRLLQWKCDVLSRMERDRDGRPLSRVLGNEGAHGRTDPPPSSPHGQRSE